MDQLPDAHLQSPIRKDERYLFCHGLSEDIPYYLSYLRTNSPILPQHLNMESERTYGRLLGGVYNWYVEPTEWVDTQLPGACNAAYQVISVALQAMNEEMVFKRPDLHPQTRRLFACAIFWEDLRNTMQLSRKSGYHGSAWKRYTQAETLFTVCYLSGSFLLGELEGIVYIYDYLQILMICDTIWGRVNAIMMNYMLLPSAVNRIPPELIITLYKHLDETFKTWGNETYTGIKCWESVIFGKIIQIADPLQSSLNFYREMVTGAVGDGFTYIQTLADILDHEELRVEQLSELYGLYRHWGHPTVNEELGCLKIKKIVRNRPVPKNKTLMEVKGALIRQFCASFIALEGRWPHITNVTELSSQKLRTMACGHTRHMNLFMGDIPLVAWAEIRFGKELPFDYYPDFTELVEDKSIAPYRSDLRSIYNHECLGYHPPRLSYSRRLLKAILETTEIDIPKLFEYIRTRSVPLDWLIVLIHAKERELKLKPRMFALLTLYIRLYFGITEKNIKDHLFKFYPQQTMTLSGNELTKRLLGFSKSHPSSDYSIVYVMIDFQAWNTHWTKMSTDDVFRTIDELMGLEEIYTYSHEFFANSLIALTSYLNPPETVKGNSNKTGLPEECDTLWYNHNGGFDGIRQKGWTILTIGMLLLVESRTGIKSQKIGQADNQVCKLYIPKVDRSLSDEDYILKHKDDINSQTTIFMNTLNGVANDLGLKVKADESAISSNCIVYGKEIIVNGAYLPQSIKKISRALTDVNELYPSILAKVTSLQSAGLSAADKGYNPVIPCYYTSILTLIHFAQAIRFSHLTCKPISRNLRTWFDSEDAKVFILISNADQGCLPIQNIVDYLYKGHPDSLTSYTTYLHLIASKITLAKKLYLYLQERDYALGEANPELLISNPCSTNLKTPPLLSTRFKNVLEQAVISATKNVKLKALFPTDSSKVDKDLFEFLIAHEPLHPRFLHELFRLTPTAARFTFLAKFSNTRTAKQIFHTMQSKRAEMDEVYQWNTEEGYDDHKELYLKVDDIDTTHLEHIKTMYSAVLKKPVSDTLLICPTSLALDMRHYSWAPLIGDRKLEGVTVPHPCHQFSLSMINDTLHSTCLSSVEYISFLPDSVCSEELLCTRGTYPPYVGSRTRERVAGRIYTIMAGARPYKAAERAVTLSSWCVDEEGSLYQFMMELAESRTDVPLSILKQTSGYISGGTMPHRLDDHVTKQGTSNNMIPNITTHIMISTDTMGRFSRGLENYVMHFQGIEHTGVALINIMCCLEVPVPLGYHMHYKGICCEEQIHDFKITGNHKVPTVKSYPGNPLLYSELGETVYTRTNMFSGFHVKNNKSASWAIAHILLARIKQHISHQILGQTEKSEHQSGPIGVQEVMRIGLSQTVRDLAILIVLHIDSSIDDVYFFISSIPLDVWADVSQVILLPEILPRFARYLNIDGLPDMYSKSHVISKALTNRLKQEVSYLVQNQSTEVKTWHIHPFHVTRILKISMVLRMWAKYIHLVSSYQYNIKSIIRETVNEYYQFSSTATGTLPAKISSILDRKILEKLGYEGYHYVCVEHRLTLAYNPPETVLRTQSSETFTRDQMCPALRIKPVMDSLPGPYPLELRYPPRSQDANIRDLEISQHSSVRTGKSKADQFYRTTGQVSTAYLKYLEILLRESWNPEGYAVCVAEGEGSVARMFSILTGNATVYNSLIDRKTLPAQRGYQYIPGAFIDAPDKLIGGELAVLCGGDLTSQITIDKIVDLIEFSYETPPFIITCDAECSGGFTPVSALEIITSVIRISIRCKIDKAIIKHFCNNSSLTSLLGSYLQCIWRKVKVCVPTYSSNENTECFWVCEVLNPMISLAAISALPSTKIFSINSALSFLPSIDRFLQERRSWDYPIQRRYNKTAKILETMGLELGFRSNVDHAYDMITCHLVPYDPSLSVNANLDRFLPLLDNMIVKLLRGYQMTYEGHALVQPAESAITHTESLHRNVERYCTALFNIHFLYKCLTLTNIPRQELLNAIGDTLCDHIYIRDNKSVVIYDFYIQDEMTW
ncbi:RNA-dependent RNA polymerase, partial [Hymenopteran arli-related virus OKIAV100]